MNAQPLVVSPPETQAGDALDLAIGAIFQQLEAAAASVEFTHQQLSLLPPAEHFQVVDIAVRQWATLRKATIIDVKPCASTMAGMTIEVYRVALNGYEIATVHIPQEVQVQRAERRRAREHERAQADQVWSPAHGARQ